MEEQTNGHVPADDVDLGASDSPFVGSNMAETRRSEGDKLVIDNYPDMPSLDEEEDLNEESEREILEAVQQRIVAAGTMVASGTAGNNSTPPGHATAAHAASGTASIGSIPVPDGFVSNAEDATATSEEFVLWSPADQSKIGIGTIVRHEAIGPAGKQIETHAIVVGSTGRTLGLDSLAIHSYEHDGIPPAHGIQPAPSRRRPIVAFEAKVLSTNADGIRPVLSGPVMAVKGSQVLAAHLPLQGKARDATWMAESGMLLGFYEDGNNDYGIFAEERARVLGPKQGHVIFSGTPGSGKTSQYLTLLLSLFAQLRTPAAIAAKAPDVASLAFNVKGPDLLFLDHQNADQLQPEDWAMWKLANVIPTQPAFGRVRFLVPLASDCLNRHSLRNNPAADKPGYSTTTTFALGIADLWPHLDLLFDDRSSSATNLLAEIRLYFEGRSRQRSSSYTLAQVLDLFATTLLPKAARDQSDFAPFHANTIRGVYQRLRGLGAMLGGLIDHTGTGFGLDALDDLQPFDLVVIDLERLLTNPPDPELADIMLKIVTSLVLHKVTEAVTRKQSKVDNVIVFADELNTLAPAQGRAGVGDYLAHLARTTRDRGVVLFGAGQFRSGINKDILKAASVHFSMQTPEYELQDALYANLSPEMKARLGGLLPGHTLLQFPSMRKPVFARFPRPFVLTGTDGLNRFPALPPRPLGECIAERLAGVDPNRPPLASDVISLVDGYLTTSSDEDAQERIEQELQELLRDVEMEYARTRAVKAPWERYRDLARQQLGGASYDELTDLPSAPTPIAAFDEEEDD